MKENIFLIDFMKIQPSQLYLNEDKINKFFRLFNEEKYKASPIPIFKLNNFIIFLDGHSRVYVMWKLGFTQAEVYWGDMKGLNLDLYVQCVRWCRNEGIYTIADLQKKIIDNNSYQKKWIRRCEIESKNLKKKSNRIHK